MSAPTPPKPSVAAEATAGPEQGSIIPRETERAAVKDSDPKKRMSAREMQVYVATETFMTREVVSKPVHIAGGHYTNRPIAAGREIVIKQGTVFQELGELRERGFSAEAIEGLIRGGKLASRTLDRIYAQSIGTPPVALGNSTGSKGGDADLGLRGQNVHQNNPDAKWGYHPNNISHMSLSELQARISSVDPGMTPPDSESECIRILSQDYHS